MDEFIKLPDSCLDYVSHEIVEDTILIRVASNKEELYCPYCGAGSSKKHSQYGHSFQDLPIIGKKCRIIIQNRKMFCTDSDCGHTTFAEPFDFIRPKAKKSNRLPDKIIDISLNASSLNAADVLRDGIADIGKSTIRNLWA